MLGQKLVTVQVVLVIGVSVWSVVEVRQNPPDQTPPVTTRDHPSTALKLHHVLGRYLRR